MKGALSDERNTMVCAISSGLPVRLNGTPPTKPAFLSFIVVSTGDNDAGTVLREGQGGGTSDARQGAGNKDNGSVFRWSIHIVLWSGLD